MRKKYYWALGVSLLLIVALGTLAVSAQKGKVARWSEGLEVYSLQTTVDQLTQSDRMDTALQRLMTFRQLEGLGFSDPTRAECSVWCCDEVCGACPDDPKEVCCSDAKCVCCE